MRIKSGFGILLVGLLLSCSKVDPLKEIIHTKSFFSQFIEYNSNTHVNFGYDVALGLQMKKWQSPIFNTFVGVILDKDMANNWVEFHTFEPSTDSFVIKKTVVINKLEKTPQYEEYIPLNFQDALDGKMSQRFNYIDDDICFGYIISDYIDLSLINYDVGYVCYSFGIAKNGDYSNYIDMKSLTQRTMPNDTIARFHKYSTGYMEMELYV